LYVHSAKNADLRAVNRICAELLFTNTGAPIENGIVECDTSGKILRVLAPGDESYSTDGALFIEGWVCAGFINAHCHLELSHLKNRIAEQTGLDGFIDALGRCETNPEAQLNAMQQADRDMEGEGIVAVIDICNTAASFAVKAHSNLHYHSLIERFGILDSAANTSNEKGLDLLQALRHTYKLNGNLTPHAPYSLSPALGKKIKESFTNHPGIYSIHFMESAGETELFTSGNGPMANRLSSWGFFEDGFPHTQTTPLDFIRNSLPENAPLLFVHNTFIDQPTLDALIPFSNRVYFALCPRANLYIENRLPDVHLLIANQAKIVVGTDSLASNYNLSMLEELKAIQHAFPEISSEQLFTWSSKNAAELLGKADEMGSIEAGKRPGLVQIYPVDKVSKKLIKNSFAKQICL
jgi:cytosine/adenosine deaminase-related metal-dependent hydrolase